MWNKKEKIEFFNNEFAIIENYPILESKNFKPKWIEKARKLPETAESALNQLNKLEQYNRDSEDRHTELMAKVLREQRTVYLALVTIMIGLGVSFWFFR